jgi:hypothetical protein
VISKVRLSFRRAFERRAPPVKARARMAYKLFAENPNHPSLRFKKLQGSNCIWSVRISEQFRAVGVRSGDAIEWIWIGTHNEFDKLFS